jgi:hypothetical protein
MAQPLYARVVGVQYCAPRGVTEHSRVSTACDDGLLRCCRS